MDAIHYKVREDKQVVIKAAYVVIGVNLDEKKEVLGMWIGANELSKFWLSVLNDLKNTIDFINNINVHGIKIHSTYIVKNTVLCDMYNNKEYIPITLDEYLDYLEYTITHLKDTIIIHRLSGDAPKDILVAPEWNLHKKWILNGINKRLTEKNLYQGIYYNK